jgi:predicted XRE-type DNA-binding protein
MKNKKNLTTLIRSTEAFCDMVKKRPGYAEDAAAFDLEYAIAKEMAMAREKSGLTQGQIARRMGTTQSSVSRMATGRISVASLERYFDACGAKLKIVAMF